MNSKLHMIQNRAVKNDTVNNENISCTITASSY